MEYAVLCTTSSAPVTLFSPLQNTASDNLHAFQKVVKVEAQKAREHLNRDAGPWTGGTGTPGAIDMPPHDPTASSEPVTDSTARVVSAPHASAFDGYAVQEWGWGLSYQGRGSGKTYVCPPLLVQTKLEGVAAATGKVLKKAKEIVGEGIEAVKVGGPSERQEREASQTRWLNNCASVFVYVCCRVCRVQSRAAGPIEGLKHKLEEAEDRMQEAAAEERRQFTMHSRQQREGHKKEKEEEKEEEKDKSKGGPENQPWSQ